MLSGAPCRTLIGFVALVDGAKGRISYGRTRCGFMGALVCFIGGACK